MSIIFKPTGTLDVSTDPSELPEDKDQFTMVSGAMQRCKNLRLNQKGKIVTRDGSTVLNVTAMAGTPDFIIEEGGVRYVFTDQYVYKDEALITEGVNVATPTFNPVAGEYSTPQTVTITCTTPGASIFYTLDGSTPTISSLPYPTSGVIVPSFGLLKAIGVRSGWVTSAVGSAYYSVADGAFITEYFLDHIITETDGDQIVTEGT